MIAGTLGILESPTDDPLESWFNDGHLPALDVERTQSSFDDRPIQQGTAATRTETNERQADLGRNMDGEYVAIDVTDVPVLTDHVTEWVADVTGSGLVVPESVDGEDRFSFPFDLFAYCTGRNVHRLAVGVSALHVAWSADDALGDVWMVGAQDDDATSIDYHDAADPETEPTIGLGFVRPWNGTVERGVVYESGYVAVYSTNTASSFVRFVDEELLPYTDVKTDDSLQQTLGDSGGVA